jgi:hypothetical protein
VPRSRKSSTPSSSSTVFVDVSCPRTTETSAASGCGC